MKLIENSGVSLIIKCKRRFGSRVQLAYNWQGPHTCWTNGTLHWSSSPYTQNGVKSSIYSCQANTFACTLALFTSYRPRQNSQDAIPAQQHVCLESTIVPFRWGLNLNDCTIHVTVKATSFVATQTSQYSALGIVGLIAYFASKFRFLKMGSLRKLEPHEAFRGRL